MEGQVFSSQGKEDVQINKRILSSVKKERKRLQQRGIVNKITLDSSDSQPVLCDSFGSGGGANDPFIGVF